MQKKIMFALVLGFFALAGQAQQTTKATFKVNKSKFKSGPAARFKTQGKVKHTSNTVTVSQPAVAPDRQPATKPKKG